MNIPLKIDLLIRNKGFVWGITGVTQIICGEERCVTMLKETTSRGCEFFQNNNCPISRVLIGSLFFI